MSTTSFQLKNRWCKTCLNLAKNSTELKRKSGFVRAIPSYLRNPKHQSTSSNDVVHIGDFVFFRCPHLTTIYAHQLASLCEYQTETADGFQRGFLWVSQQQPKVVYNVLEIGVGASHARSCALLHLCLLKQQHSIYLFQSSLVSLVKYSRYDKFIQILHASFQPKCSKASPHGPMAWAALLASVETNTLPQRKFGNWSRLCPLLERISPVARVNHILQTHFSRWLFQQHMGISKKKIHLPIIFVSPFESGNPWIGAQIPGGNLPQQQWGDQTDLRACWVPKSGNNKL